MAANWKKIKADYVTSELSYRKLSEKYGITYGTIFERGKKENWKQLREQYREKTMTKIMEQKSDREAARMARLNSLTDRLLDKVEKSIDELDASLVVHRVKAVTEDGEEAVSEWEEIRDAKSIIDRKGVKQLASAMRDLRDVAMLRTALDRQEQEARIERLRRDTEKTEAADSYAVEIGGHTDWAE